MGGFVGTALYLPHSVHYSVESSERRPGGIRFCIGVRPDLGGIWRCDDQRAVAQGENFVLPERVRAWVLRLPTGHRGWRLLLRKVAASQSHFCDRGVPLGDRRIRRFYGRGRSRGQTRARSVPRVVILRGDRLGDI